MIYHFMEIRCCPGLCRSGAAKQFKDAASLESLNRSYVVYPTHCPERREPS
jgi:hypothetical protein